MARYAPGSVVYSLTAEDRAAYLSAVALERKRSGAPFAIVAIGFIALGAFELALEAAAFSHVPVLGRMWRPDYPFAFFGAAYVVMGLFWAIVARRGLLLWFGRPKLVAARTLAWNETGVTFSRSGEPTRALAWSSIRRIAYVGECVSIDRAFGSDVVPARAFLDGGGDFMIYADDRLVSKRLVVRSSQGTR